MPEERPPTPEPLAFDAAEEALDVERKRVDLSVSDLSDQVAMQAHAILGIDMPRHGLRVSALLGLRARRDFVDRFLPELREKSGDASADLGAWIDERIADYGRDARALVRGGVALWLESEELVAGAEARIRAAFDLEAQV